MALTVAQIQQEISNILRAWEIQNVELSVKFQTVFDDLVANVDTPDPDPQGDQVLTAIKAMISSSGLAISIESLATALAGQFLNLTEFLNIQSTSDVTTIARELKDHMIANALTVLSRTMTFGAPSFTGDGDGELIVLPLDFNDQKFEAVNAEVQTFRITQDQTTPGSQGRNNEGYEVRGETVDPNSPFFNYEQADFEKSGALDTFKVISQTDVEAIQNGSFDDYVPSEFPVFTGPLTELTGWTVDSFVGVSIDTTNIWITNDGVSRPVSVTIIDEDRTFSQKFSDTQFKFDVFQAYYPTFYYARDFGVGATGSIKLTWGSQSQTVVLAAETGFTRFPTTLDKKLHSRNFTNIDEPELKIETISLAGQLNIDHVILVPFNEFQGLPHLLLAGQTPFVNLDKFTVAITAAVSAVVQKWFSRVTGISMPSTAAGNTWPEPSL